jgi:hypothetical protein
MKHWRECKTDAEKRKFVKETVREYFPSAREDEDDIGFQGAVVLIAALVAGTNVENPTVLTGYPREFVAHISFRARSAGLWVNERVCYEHWFEGDSVKPMANLYDVMVVEGELIRKRNEEGEFRYKVVRPS